MKNEIGWIDVNNDQLMVDLGIRNPIYEPLDIWRKTSQEKKLLRSLRRTCKNQDNRFHYSPKQFIPVKAKLIVYLKSNKKFPVSTHSIECWQSDIDQILMFFSKKDRNTGFDVSLISKYVFNGKTYSPSERPFWH